MHHIVTCMSDYRLGASATSNLDEPTNSTMLAPLHLLTQLLVAAVDYQQPLNSHMLLAI